MSMYEQMYLGMYIQMEYKFKHGGWNTNSGCPNGHHINKDDIFCSSCGSEILVEHTKKITPVTYEELVDDRCVPADIDDFLVINIDTSDKTWLVQNLTKGKYGLFLDDADCGLYSLSMDTDVVATQFKTEFEDVITALKEHCKNVEVGFGIIKYYN